MNLWFEFLLAQTRLRGTRGEDVLVSAGIPIEMIRQEPGHVGAWPVQPSAEGLVQLEDPPEGRNAVLVPVGAWCWPSGNVGVGNPMWDYVEDLVAFQLNRPAEWRRITGAAVWLGSAYLDEVRAEGTPAQLVATPLDWLRAGGRAACLLDWSADPRRELHGLEVECADTELAGRLRKHIRELDRSPIKISVAAKERADRAA